MYSLKSQIPDVVIQAARIAGREGLDSALPEIKKSLSSLELDEHSKEVLKEVIGKLSGER